MRNFALNLLVPSSFVCLLSAALGCSCAIIRSTACAYVCLPATRLAINRYRSSHHCVFRCTSLDVSYIQLQCVHRRPPTIFGPGEEIVSDAMCIDSLLPARKHASNCRRGAAKSSSRTRPGVRKIIYSVATTKKGIKG